MVVSSSVLDVLSRPPFATSSSESAAYVALVREFGGAGLNCEALRSASVRIPGSVDRPRLRCRHPRYPAQQPAARRAAGRPNKEERPDARHVAPTLASVAGRF